MKVMTTSKQVNLNRNSSKGNQLKWFDAGVWYKADYLGYEALAEYVISKLLRKTNVPDFVNYEIMNLEYQKKTFTGCSSLNFLEEGCELITIEKLFRKYKDVELTKEIARMDVHDKIKYVVNGVEEITGLEGFGQYLTMILELDAFFLNEDRHTHNIAIVLNNEGKYEYCPIFDNGAGLFSDTTISYDMNVPLEECYKIIEAKPFDRNFDIQMDAAEELYGCPFKYWFSLKDVEDVIKETAEYYEKNILDRVVDVMAEQLRKYKYLGAKEPLSVSIDKARNDIKFKHKENKKEKEIEKL